MLRSLLILLLQIPTFLLLAQPVGVDENPDFTPSPAWYDHPALWVVLAAGLVAALFVLRSRTRRPTQ
ncbi:hypothetical protein [Lewinella sp. IMCC34183]|uniref:hypothetical protein n=1 Tax=Lewinella sp. IMCC34183 TaxID=2248762 RepID=UPI000E24FE8F|nr:hypothetical protein [Lewinella sp. IMCC34183]